MKTIKRKKKQIKKKKQTKKKKNILTFFELFNLNRYSIYFKIFILLFLSIVISIISTSSISKYEIQREKEYSNYMAFVDEKIDFYNNTCIDNSCPVVINSLNKFKKKINKNTSIDNINKTYVSLNEYLKDITTDEYTDILDLIVPDNHKEIANLLNNAELKPMITGYEELDNKVDSILSEITNNTMTTYDKVKAIYDWEIKTMSYYGIQPDYKEIKKYINETGVSDLDGKKIYLANSLLKNNKGTCDYYSALFMIFTRRIGLESYSVSAITNNGSNHTSVNIKLGDTYYTFDPQGEDKSLVNGQIKYIFFGKTDKEISKIQTYPIRKQSIKDFNNFKIEKELLEIKLKLGNFEITKRTIDKLQYEYENTLDLEYIENENNIFIEVDSNRQINYSLDYGNDEETVFGENKITGTLLNGRIYLLQNESKKTKMYLKFIDENNREIIFIFNVNFIKYGEKFSIETRNINFLNENEATIEIDVTNGSFPFKSVMCTIKDSNDIEKLYKCEQIVDNDKIIFNISGLKNDCFYILEFYIKDNIDRIIKSTYTINKN